MKKFNKILLIEDEYVDAFLSTNLLQQMDVADEIEVCRDGQEALDLLETLRKQDRLESDGMDLILLDIKMPGMDGIEFLQELREKFTLHSTVVILSASNNAKDIEQSGKYQASYYLVKPLTEEKVKKMIERCFTQA